MPGYTNLTILINGTEQTNLPNDLIEVVVDTAIFLPGMFSLVINDHDYTYMGDTTNYKPGVEVEIKVSINDTPTSLFKGHITAIEPEFSADGSSLLQVRGYDKAFKLNQGKYTRSFSNQTDDAMIKSVISERGLSPDVDTCTPTHDLVIQYNQTDWDFIVSRARRNGLVVYYKGDKVCVKKPAELTPAPAELDKGTNLSRFEPRLSVLGQLTKATAYGWDQKLKQVVTHTQTSAPSTPFRSLSGTGTAAAGEVLSASAEVIADVPVTTVDEAKALATARINQAESKFLQAEGECIGDPKLMAGCLATISGVSSRFSGSYYITQAQHIIRGGNYTVRFHANGTHPETLHSLVFPENSEVVNRIDGVVTAIVTNLNDPDALGRVKVKYPWIPLTSGAEIESGWVRIALGGAGNKRGFAFMPEVDDEVLVAFDHGDINSPYIVGALWNNTDKPPDGMVVSGKVEQRVVQSKSGHLIILNDKAGEEKITIKDKTGKNSIVINSPDNSMTIKVDGDLTIEAGGKLTLKSTGALAVTSSDAAEIKATKTLDMKSDQAANVSAGQSKVELAAAGAAVKGMKVDITANTTAAVKGNAMVEIQGGIVKIN